MRLCVCVFDRECEIVYVCVREFVCLRESVRLCVCVLERL